jgi:hypothetical protein
MGSLPLLSLLFRAAPTLLLQPKPVSRLTELLVKLSIFILELVNYRAKADIRIL